MRFKAFGWLNIAAQASPRSVSRNGGRRSRLCFPVTVGAALAFVEPFHGDLSVDKVDFIHGDLNSHLASRVQKPVNTAVRDLAELQTTDPIAGKCATLFRTHIALGFERGKRVFGSTRQFLGM